MARTINVEIVGDSRKLERAFARSSRSAKSFNRDMSRNFTATARVTSSLARTLTGLGAGFVGLAGVGLVIREAFGEMAQAQKVSAQTAAVLESTGGAAGVTADDIRTMSESLMQLSGADDEVIQSGANMLATFTQVRNEAGRGNDIFTRATAAALDMSFALGIDMTQASLRLGKALNDPVRGITALRRSGVQFTKSQEKQIKAWVESGQIVRAQKAILRELNTEFGNSARAAGDTLPGKLNILKESLRNLAGTIAEQLSPKIKEVVDRLNVWLGDPENQQQVIDDITGAVKGLADAFRALADAIKLASDALQKVRDFKGFLEDTFGKRVGGFKLKDLWGKGSFDEVKRIREETTVLAAHNRALQEHFDIVKRGRTVEHARPGRRPPRADLGTPGGGRRGITATQRNQWFDARVARQLDRLQDLSLRKQLAGLKQIAAAIRARLAATKDITRRLTLEDKLLHVLRQQKAVQGEIAEQVRAANEALKDRADAIKSAVIERLQRRQTDILNKRALADAQEQLRIARQIGGPRGIREARRGLSDAQFDIMRTRLENAPATLTRGGRFQFAGVVINIQGVTDPAAVANRVAAILKRRGKHKTPQTRGATAAA